MILQVLSEKNRLKTVENLLLATRITMEKELRFVGNYIVSIVG